jgi:hypothetical protein
MTFYTIALFSFLSLYTFENLLPLPQQNIIPNASYFAVSTEGEPGDEKATFFSFDGAVIAEFSVTTPADHDRLSSMLDKTAPKPRPEHYATSFFASGDSCCHRVSFRDKNNVIIKQYDQNNSYFITLKACINDLDLRNILKPLTLKEYAFLALDESSLAELSEKNRKLLPIVFAMRSRTEPLYKLKGKTLGEEWSELIQETSNLVYHPNLYQACNFYHDRIGKGLSDGKDPKEIAQKIREQDPELFKEYPLIRETFLNKTERLISWGAFPALRDHNGAHFFHFLKILAALNEMRA